MQKLSLAPAQTFAEENLHGQEADPMFDWHQIWLDLLAI
jgi:hypothetical protein